MTEQISMWSCPLCLDLVPRYEVCSSCRKAMTSNVTSSIEDGRLAANPTDWAVWAPSDSVNTLQVEPGWITTFWENRDQGRQCVETRRSYQGEKSYALRSLLETNRDACLIRAAPIPLDFPLQGCETADGTRIDVHIVVALSVNIGKSMDNARVFVINMVWSRNTVSLNDIRKKYWTTVRSHLVGAIHSYSQADILSQTPHVQAVMEANLQAIFETDGCGLSVKSIRFHDPRKTEDGGRADASEIIPAHGCDKEETVARELLARMTS